MCHLQVLLDVFTFGPVLNAIALAYISVVVDGKCQPHKPWSYGCDVAEEPAASCLLLVLLMWLFLQGDQLISQSKS